MRSMPYGICFWFRAPGRKGLPQRLFYDFGTYRLRKTLKNDFFAVTALYERDDLRLAAAGTAAVTPAPAKIILKLARETLLGRLLCNHELGIYGRLKGVEGIPLILSRFRKTGFVYEYIEGRTLDEQPRLPDDYFDNLHNLLKRLHSRDVAYLDMNKRGNIIAGCDGKPHLIDFQISLYLPGLLLKWLRNVFQRADVYHYFKHKRRFCPCLLTDEELVLLYRPGLLMRIRHFIANPCKKIRRAFFRYLYHKGILALDSAVRLSRENDPARFLKQH